MTSRLKTSGRRGPEGGGPAAWTVLRKGVGHPVTRMAAIALLQALAARLGDAGPGRTCGCQGPGGRAAM
ncbi:hypothetical protein [Streptomyces rubradiris]|uniref:Uncharacterized protein n=1 Tax=Streptomyces rubradiris TaxID=285531 RepID=A0ABQ3RBF0_STRRR|nr:hypothetical protein [Streptomyces rubradiris]GHH27824.1 hypothetical protein GCM10018792_70680 [Streptomyces rubradiris]GHI53181.1 hypothetical protein Srubr_30270 [Streptomyces rubradiris]